MTDLEAMPRKGNMKREAMKRLGILLALCASTVAGSPQSGGGFTLVSSTIAGGGGASASNQFVLNGTVGQANAGRLSGGSFALEAGFWHQLVLVQSEGGPKLNLKIVGTNAVISWPIGADAYQLQFATHLGGAWTNEPSTVLTTRAEHSVTLPAAGVMKYFRLSRQLAGDRHGFNSEISDPDLEP